MKEKSKVCCICGKKFTEWGNNPWPVKNDGECCNECNMNYVITARINLIYNKKTGGDFIESK